MGKEFMIELKKTKQLEHIIYPITVVQDRYGGCYSGAGWIAWNLESESVPHDPQSDDVSCANFWYENTETVGKGNSPDEAVIDLARNLAKTKNPELLKE